MSGASPLVVSGREDENTRPVMPERTSGPETIAAALGHDRSGFVAALDAAVSTTSVDEDEEDEDE